MSTPSRTDAEGLGDKPSPRPRADLSAAFGPPNRSGGLVGRLARSPQKPSDPDTRAVISVPPTVEPIALDVTPVVEDNVQAAASLADAEEAAPGHATTGPSPLAKEPATRRPRKPARGKVGKSETAQLPGLAEGGTVTSIVYLPGELLERLRRARATTGFTYTQLTLDALDGTHQILSDLVTQATAPRARPAGSLFSGPSSAATAVQPKVQITLRPRSSDAAVIDQLATTHGVSRSQLVSLALDAHLKAN